MGNIKAPAKLSQDVKDYIVRTFHPSDSQNEMVEFIEMIPPSYKRKVINSVFEMVLYKNEASDEVLHFYPDDSFS